VVSSVILNFHDQMLVQVVSSVILNFHDQMLILLVHIKPLGKAHRANLLGGYFTYHMVLLLVQINNECYMVGSDKFTLFSYSAG
jgi:hypothetical protein